MCDQLTRRANQPVLSARRQSSQSPYTFTTPASPRTAIAIPALPHTGRKLVSWDSVPVRSPAARSIHARLIPACRTMSAVGASSAISIVAPANRLHRLLSNIARNRLGSKRSGSDIQSMNSANPSSISADGRFILVVSSAADGKVDLKYSAICFAPIPVPECWRRAAAAHPPKNC